MRPSIGWFSSVETNGNDRPAWCPDSGAPDFEVELVLAGQSTWTRVRVADSSELAKLTVRVGGDLTSDSRAGLAPKRSAVTPGKQPALLQRAREHCERLRIAQQVMYIRSQLGTEWKFQANGGNVPCDQFA